MGGAAFAWSVIELVVFTALAPPAAVAFSLVAARCAFERLPASLLRAYASLLMVPLAIVTVGFVVSATHLGNPGNALYVFTRVGSSGLSNEVLATALFLGASGLLWVASLLANLPFAVRRAWLIVCIALAGVYLVLTSRTYCMPTIPTWSMPASQALLVILAFAGGSVMGQLLLGAGERMAASRDGRPAVGAGVDGGRAVVPVDGQPVADGERDGVAPRSARASGRLPLVLAGICTAVACAVMVVQWTQLHGMANSYGQAVDLVLRYPLVIAVYAVCLAAAIVLSWRTSGRLVETPVGLGPRAALCLWAPALTAIVLMYGATFFVRFQFYCMYLPL